MRRRRLLGVAVAAAVGAAALGTVWYIAATPASVPGADGAVATAPILRQTLSATVTLDARIGFGQESPLACRATGTVTWLAPVGSTVDRGGVLLRSDERPVVLLVGSVPAYRTLGPGVEGADARQLEQNLVDLGYTGFTADRTYTDATADAVRRWQHALGVAETGRVEPADVIVAADAVRVTGHKVRLGASATGDVLSVTGVTKVITAEVKQEAAGWAVPGAPVSVLLPGGALAGRVSVVDKGGVADPPPDGAATVTVTVTVNDQSAVAAAEPGPVHVRHVTAEARDVLTVPVGALLALGEGGYGVEVVTETGIRTVPVEVGLFAEGRVEVRSQALTEGLTVVVPG